MTANNFENGFVLEVDLGYSDALHNIQKDFPLAPTKGKIDRNMLSEYQMVYWIKQAIDVSPRQSFYRRYLQRAFTLFLTIP